MAYAIRHMRKSYPTNLTDAQWHYLKSHLPTLIKARTTENPGFPREILDAASYILRSGCVPGAAFAPRLRTPWESVYHCFRQWSLDGTFRKGEPPDPPVAGRTRLGRNPEKTCTDLWAEEEWAKEG